MLINVNTGDYVIAAKRSPTHSIIADRIVEEPNGPVLKVRKRLNDEYALATDGYYFYEIRLFRDEWLPLDPLRAALIEQANDGTLRSPVEMTWTMLVSRRPEIVQGVALERLRIKKLTPRNYPALTKDALFPREVLEYLELRKRPAVFSYANITSLTQGLRQVRWTRISNQGITGVFKLPDFRMSSESLK